MFMCCGTDLITDVNIGDSANMGGLLGDKLAVLKCCNVIITMVF